ncbi:tetratricopeptide repeat protein [Maribacter halichondriae]|uniref:tetratricopeptide repeat protein n=1 Tax=Maribacter halichondriae TaxID=2980554 RepID=UPI0023581438|nr:hypothetical protein [Maribacter sp. Hal144]
MKKIGHIILIVFGVLLFQIHTYAQEDQPEISLEPSAEVFLEDYSDEFQEKFFEALKQKGIENHDKAINLLLECKQLDDANSVVDHELAKAYFEDNQFISAQGHAVEAVLSEPANLWYLNTLVNILQNQGSSIEDVKSKIPMDNVKLQENLALIYFKKSNYEEALKVLKGIKGSSFTKELSSKINDSIENREQEEKSRSVSFSVTNEGSSNPLDDYKVRIEGFIRGNNLGILDQLSAEALEIYPSLPFFYYARGYALNKKKKHKEAIEVLEAALDYLLDDPSLANKIYQQLADAYTATNNTSKANMYLRKVKPGF